MISLKQFPYLFASLFSAVALLVAFPALARIVIDSHGQVQMSSGRVLSSSSGSGGDSSGSGSSGSESSEDNEDNESDSSDSSGTSDSGSSGSSTINSPTPTPTKTETRSSDGTRTKTEIKKDGEVRTEVRLPDGTKIKTRAEEGRTRTDVYQGATKVRFEREGDRFRIKAENELGQEVTLEDRKDDELAEDENEAELKGTLVKVDNVFQLTTNGVTYTLLPAEGLALDSLVGQVVEVKGSPTDASPTTLAVTKAKLEDETEDEIVVEERADLLRIRALQSKAIVERLNVQALTDLPLSVDLNTNILTVTTPAGEKQVTVLPDQAVQNMLAANAIDRLGGQALVEEVRQGNIQTL
ncbi:MAG: hypothetical protein HYZ62_01215, partial [Candidatus Andersenbacteria bacterium]|nr:hypothetical protein [Candidatus Andersenbacteria bacterium]